MAKPPKNAPPAKPAPPVAPAPAPVAPAAPSAPAPVPSVEPTATTTAPATETSPPPPPPPAHQPENLTPPAPKAASAKPARKETEFVRVKAGAAPVSEGGIVHDKGSEFTIPRARLPHLADIVTFIADVPGS